MNVLGCVSEMGFLLDTKIKWQSDKSKTSEPLSSLQFKKSKKKKTKKNHIRLNDCLSQFSIGTRPFFFGNACEWRRTDIEREWNGAYSESRLHVLLCAYCGVCCAVCATIVIFRKISFFLWSSAQPSFLLYMQTPFLLKVACLVHWRVLEIWVWCILASPVC